MKKKLFLLIIIFNSLTLLGIILTQAYWVSKAYQLQKVQFSNSVVIALKGVMNQMHIYSDHYFHSIGGSKGSENTPLLPGIENIDAKFLDEKMMEEFQLLNLGRDYKYAVIDIRNEHFVMGDFEPYQRELQSSRHQIKWTAINNAESFVLSVYFPNERNIIINRITRWLVLSIIFTVLAIAAYLYMALLVIRQKRLSEIKADFINNMTHEFKTPLATISLASEMLMTRSVQDDPSRMHRYARIIYDENSRLQNHIEQILRVSMLEKGKFKLRKKETDLHDLLKKVVETFDITVKERQGELKYHFCAKNFIVMADSVHMTNVITNLLDNANKYSAGAPEIKVGTYNDENGIIISVEDKGIGIDHENQEHVFKNLYRVPTGNIYNRDKGFGIGLYYVKTIIEAHGGHIKLKSELGKGSRFDIYLPYLSKSSEVYEESDKA